LLAALALADVTRCPASYARRFPTSTATTPVDAGSWATPRGGFRTRPLDHRGVNPGGHATGGEAGTVILRAGELPPGKSRKFFLSCAGQQLECFVVNFRGTLRAYVNKCRHVPMTMDWVENQFFDESGDYLLCPTHGALYEPQGGECVSGPACGKALFAVPLVERDDEVLALCPAVFE